MTGMSENFGFAQTTRALAFPELPALNERWTMRRKATLVFAVRSGRISIEEACQTYKLSVDEFLAWERDLERYVSLACARRSTRLPRRREKSRAGVGRLGSRSALRRCRTMLVKSAIQPCRAPFSDYII